MKTTMLPEEANAKSPAGADIRYLMEGKTGNMIHSTVPPHQVNKATVHATVSEFWYVISSPAPPSISRWERRSNTETCPTRT